VALLAWLSKIQRALHECAESIRRADKCKRNLQMPSNDPLEVRAVVSFDKEFVRDSAAQDNRNHATQNSIKNATWAAFYGVAAYALVTTFMWCAMRDQTKLLTHQVKDAADALHFAYRPQVFIDGITGAGIEPAGDRQGQYRVAWDGTNYGNSVAHDVRIFEFHEFTIKRDTATRLPYQEITDPDNLIAPTKVMGKAFFIRLSSADQAEVKRGDYLTVSVRITYQGNFPEISYYAERCTCFKTTGPNHYSAIDNAPCLWPVENGWQENH
jgi:hypothetical protein